MISRAVLISGLDDCDLKRKQRGWQQTCSWGDMTYKYSDYHHVPCRTCMKGGEALGEAIKPVVGVTVGGDYLLLCGHQQESGEGQSRGPSPLRMVGHWLRD